MSYIRKEDIDYTKTLTSQANIHLDNYDMYYVEITLKNGQQQKIRIFTDKGTLPDFKSQKFKSLYNKHENRILDFLENRLWDSNGLMAKMGRQDYIYLGSFFETGNSIDSRYLTQPNGKTGQQNFDNNLWKIRMQVEAQEKSNIKQQNNNCGKHYAISDIHGMYGTYMDVINRLSKNDHLYIIGDVIDRGNNGIKILQDIIKRQENPEQNPKITFLIGNHELMFIQTLATMNNYKINKSDLLSIINNDRINSQIGSAKLALYDASQAKNLKRIKECEQNLKYITTKAKPIKRDFKEIVSAKNISKKDINTITNWINNNRGDTTIFDYIDTTEREQSKIFKFLYTSNVILSEKIQNKDILFVHAMPLSPKTTNKILQIKHNNKKYKVCDLGLDLKMDEIKFMVEERDASTYKQYKNAGFLTICGHTPELGKIQDKKNEGYIRIDAGCGHGRGLNRAARLALYCIEDDSVVYLDEKEEYKSPTYSDGTR